MRFYSSIYFILVSLFLIFSCQEKSEKKTSKKDNISLESKYKDLADFQWLNDDKNFSDDKYQEKFNLHFQQSLKENNFENAAAYLIAYGEAMDKQYIYDSAFVKKSIDFYKKNKQNISKEVQSYLSYYLGNQFHYNNNLGESNIWLSKCVEIDSENISHKQTQGFAHFALGQNFSRMGNLELAEKNLINALKIFEEVDDRKNQGNVYLLLHNLYTQNNAYTEAEKFIEKAMDIFKKEKDDRYTFSAYAFYIYFFIEQGDTVKTIEEINNLSNFSKNFTDITEYHKGILNEFKTFKHIAKKDIDSAVYHLELGKKLAKQTNNPDLEMRNYFQGILFSNAFKKPLEDIEKAENFYDELSEDPEGNRQYMSQIAEALFSYYQEKGQYEKANEYGTFLIKDANKKAENRVKGNLFELERKFETERKEKTILLQDKKLADQNKIIFSLIVVSIFIVLIAGILFIWNKNKSIIKEKNITENYASQLLQKTEDERKRIASDLHDSVSNELVNLRHTIENSNVQLKDKIDNILEEVRNVSRNISPVLFDKIGLKSSIEQLTERIQNQHDFFISSEIEYNGGLENDKELQLYRITQEAITNILKHANAIAGKVTITEDSKFVNVEIKDNGKGFDVNKMLEKGNCFGLLNITERTKFLNGTVNFKSDNKGTIIKLSIPK